MTQENRELLIKDLCARMPYGVKVKFRVNDVIAIEEKITYVVDGEYSYITDGKSYLTLDIIKALFKNWLDEIKPYLFPMSSMTEEQFEELKDFAGLKYEGNTLELVEWDSTCDKTLEFWLEEIPSYCVIKVFDWLNKNNFDYRGLIPMGLAIDATNLNIY